MTYICCKIHNIMKYPSQKPMTTDMQVSGIRRGGSFKRGEKTCEPQNSHVDTSSQKFQNISSFSHVVAVTIKLANSNVNNAGLAC